MNLPYIFNSTEQYGRRRPCALNGASHAHVTTPRSKAGLDERASAVKKSDMLVIRFQRPYGP